MFFADDAVHLFRGLKRPLMHLDNVRGDQDVWSTRGYRRCREKMRELVPATFDGKIGEFRPCAFFDEPLDCIRVVVRDCSITEIRVSPLLTVLEDNDADPKAGRELYVGFTIKGARHFCQQQGIDLTAPVQWSELLDRILAESPDTAVR